MGKRDKGGGPMAGGKEELKAMEAFGFEVGFGDLDVDEVRAWAAASPEMRREAMEEEAAATFMREVLTGGVKDMAGKCEGMGIDPLVHEVLGGGGEMWPKLQATGGGAGAGKSPVVVPESGRVLRSGRLCGMPAVKEGCMEGNSAMHKGVAGCSSPAPVVAGGATEGGKKMAGGSLLGVRPAAGVLGGGPARSGHGMAGMLLEKEEGYWEEVAGGCEVKSGTLCSGNVWKENGKLMASRRWVAGGGGAGRNSVEKKESGGGNEKGSGGVLVAGGFDGAAGGVAAAGGAGVAGEGEGVAGRASPAAVVAAGRQGVAGGGDHVMGNDGVAGGIVEAAGDVVAAGDVAAGAGGIAGEGAAAGRPVVAGGGEGRVCQGDDEVPMETCTSSVCGNAPSPLPHHGLQAETSSHPAEAGQHPSAVSGAAFAAACARDTTPGVRLPSEASAPTGPSGATDMGPPSKGPIPKAWTVKKCRRLEFSDSRSDFLGPDGLTVVADTADADECAAQLERALVGRVFGRELPFGALCRELRRMWSKFGAFHISSVGRSCFTCFFSSPEVRDTVLMGGPWFAAGQLIGVDKWTPLFDPQSVEGLSSPVWVRFPGLPLHLWGDRNLGRIASSVGTPLWVDTVTASWGRSEFARVCVRADFSQSLPSGVWVEADGRRFFQTVVYEGLDDLCMRCGMVGHHSEECSLAAKAVKTQFAAVGSEVTGGPTSSVSSDVGHTPVASAAVVAAMSAATMEAPSSGDTRGSGAVGGSGPVATDGGGWQTVLPRRARRPSRPSGWGQAGGSAGFGTRQVGRPPHGAYDPRGAPRPDQRSVQRGEPSRSPPRASFQAVLGGPSRLEKGKQILMAASSKRPSTPISDVRHTAAVEVDDSMAIVLVGDPVVPVEPVELGDAVEVECARKRLKGGTSTSRSDPDCGGGAPPRSR